jgi:hypothetical protein
MRPKHQYSTHDGVQSIDPHDDGPIALKISSYLDQRHIPLLPAGGIYRRSVVDVGIYVTAFL